MNTASTTNKPQYKTDEHDEQLINSIRKAFSERVDFDSKSVLVNTKVESLYDSFLDQLDPVEKAGYQCNACRRFTNTYGGLVALYPDGRKVAVCWDPNTVPEKFQKAVKAIKKLVEKADIDSVFFTKEKTWGIPRTGEWTHFNIFPSQNYSPKSVLLTPYQASAEKKEDYNILCRSIADFDINTVRQAHNLLSNETLYRSEKVLGVAQWFLDLLTKLEDNKAQKQNLLWYAVATAPPGFCHVRTTMIGTLLEDLAAGLSFADASKKFASKMNPYQYQRPTAPISNGQIEAAEKLVEKLGVAASLSRRYAKLEDLQKLWQPKQEVKKQVEGVFGHLRDDKTNTVQNSIAPAVKITWEKFRKTVLPNAEKIEVQASRYLYAFVTAANPDSPPIIQWDNEEKRNQVSWYTSGDSSPSNWNIKSGWNNVTAVSLFPFMWDDEDKYKHQEKGVLFVVEGCKHINHKGGGGGLFPEFLKSDLHSIKSVIEKHANNAVIEGVEESSASGIVFRRNSEVNVRVTSNGLVNQYTIDRWD